MSRRRKEERKKLKNLIECQRIKIGNFQENSFMFSSYEILNIILLL